MPAKADSGSDAKVSYAGAFADATLEYESVPSGLKETIVLDRAPQGGEHIYSFELGLDGLTPEPQADGSITLQKTGGGEAVFSIPAPYMEDAGTPASRPTRSDAVHYELKEGDGPGSYILDVVADLKWLTDPARAYPVYIDPSTLLIGYPYTLGADDTFISSGPSQQNDNYVGWADLWANNNWPGFACTEYIYLHPPQTLVDDLAYKKSQDLYVADSHLQLYATPGVGYWRAPGGVTGEMCVTDADVDLSTITWNAYTNNGVGQVSANHKTPELWVASAGTQARLDVTRMMSHWQDAATTKARSTVRLSVDDGTNLCFNSADSASNKPFWDIEYADARPSLSRRPSAAGSPQNPRSAGRTRTRSAMGSRHMRSRCRRPRPARPSRACTARR